MTLLRVPGTVPNAVKRIADFIGMAACIEAVGDGTVSRIRDWGYPATTACPTLAQAIALDAAYLAKGGNHAPILDAYAALLDRTVEDYDPCRRELANKLAEVAREYGDAIAATAPLTQPGHSDNDVVRAMVEIDQAQGVLATLGRFVSSFKRLGAVPGTPGGAQK